MQASGNGPIDQPPNVMGTTVPDPLDDANMMASEEFQTLLDITTTNSIKKALTSAMGVMSSTITRSITQALMKGHPRTQAPPQTSDMPSIHLPGHKTSSKRKHPDPPPHIQDNPGLKDMPQAVQDGVQQPRNRATGRAKVARHWKQMRAYEIMSDLDYSDEEGSDEVFSDPYEDKVSEDENVMGMQLATTLSKKARDNPDEPTLAFDLDDLRHLCSAEWEPPEHIAQYLALAQTPLPGGP
ncbi:Hypothetical predicted protein [Pelobates cultripes]|uniref:Uncharacterized protein n=1 Tax=Pelobates cultripes TaxID=61616 RepID=A0AAD1SN38_PELCU|nr:Hypothetical predicted protein [Pelobates cultripes]